MEIQEETNEWMNGKNATENNFASFRFAFVLINKKEKKIFR